MAIKLTKLDEAESFAGLVALGVDTPLPETPPAVVTITENELPMVAAVADIAYLRAVGAEGDSVIATPLQLRELVGIDYSKLEEQEVQGEFWRGADGVRRQVYVRTFVGTTPNFTGQYYAMILSSAMSDIQIVKSSIYLKNGVIPANIIYTDDGGITYRNGLLYHIRIDGDGNTYLALYTPQLSNVPYNITLKYTKR